MSIDERLEGKETETEETETESTEETLSPAEKRINQIYGKMKHAERELDSFKAITKNNATRHQEELAKLRETISNLEERATEDEIIPDPIEDTQGNQEYWKNKLRKQGEKNKEEFISLKASLMEDSMRSLHDDYDSVIARANILMHSDPQFKQKVDSSSNPYRAAYKEMQKIDASNNTEKDSLESNTSQSGMESGSSYSSGQGKKFGLTEEEKKAADSFGIPHKDYAKHIQKMLKEGRIRYDR